MISPHPTILNRRCPPTIGKVPKILLNITHHNDGDSACLTPQKKLLDNIDTVEKVVMEELRKLKRTPSARKAEREKRENVVKSIVFVGTMFASSTLNLMIQESNSASWAGILDQTWLLLGVSSSRWAAEARAGAMGCWTAGLLSVLGWSCRCNWASTGLLVGLNIAGLRAVSCAHWIALDGPRAVGYSSRSCFGGAAPDVVD
ncbi:UNVERIFIED_CONTAM: protein POLYCHOME [Sesamum calycinum]|uniref:Protein POLYCHOME n=1 Tax=Sesamum calycinum TaxID=2727403 RepID=A0AAW2R805_9LAMI